MNSIERANWRAEARARAQRVADLFSEIEADGFVIGAEDGKVQVFADGDPIIVSDGGGSGAWKVH